MSESLVDDRTPVIVGVAHDVQRPGPLEEIVDAVTLMERALRSAAADAGRSAILERLDQVAVAQGLWRWPDPGRLLACAVGSPGAKTVLGPACGSTPQVLLAQASARIIAGRADVVAVCGGEWVSGRARLKAAGLPVRVTPQHDGRPDEVGEVHPYESDLELARGFEQPLFIYPLMQSALRHARGETLEEDLVRCATTVSGLSEVAAANPAAWTREAWSVDHVKQIEPGNRMVAFPYTKRMVSNERVDMASAILVASVSAAPPFGISEDRWVFPHVSTRVTDLHWFSELDRIDTSADMAVACRAALEQACATADDFALLELYSCFPAAVQIEADILGIGPDDTRPLTVSGGMPVFGGPLANYIGHALVDMVHGLRERPDERGLCVANGGYLNRPAVGIYGSGPPASGFRDIDLSDVARQLPRRRFLPIVDEALTVEGVTAIEMPERPARALATGLTKDGARGLGWSEDDEVIARVRTTELVGAPLRLADDGRITALC